MSSQSFAPENVATPPDAVKASPILETQVWSRMHRRNDNWMGAVVGEVGKGKSTTCLSIGEAVDPEFTIEQVAFGLVEFMRLVIDDSYGRGSMIVMEEASIEAAAEDFHELSNKVLANVVESWRHQHRGALFNLPTFTRLDKRARIRMTALIQQEAKFEREGYSIAKYKHLQTNSDNGKIYRHFPFIRGREHKWLKIAPPSDDLIEAYEKKKADYTHELNVSLLEDLLEEQRDDDDDEKDPEWVAEDIIENGLEGYVSENNGQRYLSRTLIELDYGIGGRRSKQVKAAIERDVDDAKLEELLSTD